MPVPLDYKSPEPEFPKSQEPLAAMVCGLISGPVGAFCAMVGTAFPEPTDLVFFFMPPVAALIFGCIARSRVSQAAPSSSRWRANIAILAPIVWVGLAFYIIEAAQ